ncbi:hypothetical protein PIB30_103432 [Stylosanthes scabra]|uniref:Uncharacterized protein n=1 Tax=Stylosanthes scabra TaxID=79078 RepID=A0ABU6ZWJ9_9FABA|nr:hypothetical protein [Stylosanthes scabra]
MLGKFVHYRHNLKDFVEQFFRCLYQVRAREAHSDMVSAVGNLVLQSPLHALERSTASVLTRKIFLLFRPTLSRACTLKVMGRTYTPSCAIYTVSQSSTSLKEWQLSLYEKLIVFKWSCLRMESLGILCAHR